MKRFVWLIGLLALWSATAFAGDTLYTIRVNGLFCPYCAYGIQKTFQKISGVEAVNVDLKDGIVRVKASDSVHFTDAELMQIFKQAGFTYRGMAVAPATAPAGGH